MNYFTLATFFLALAHSTTANFGNQPQFKSVTTSVSKSVTTSVSKSVSASVLKIVSSSTQKSVSTSVLQMSTSAHPSVSTSMPKVMTTPFGMGNIMNSTMSSMQQCLKLNALQQLVSIANNVTAMAMLPAAEQTRVKAIAANVTAELTMLESNTTLVAMCRMDKDCAEFLKLQTWSTVLNNATEVQKIETELSMRDHKTMNMTVTEVNAFKANVTARLNVLMSNTTLVNECKGAAMGGLTTATTSIKAGASATTSGAPVKVTTNAAVSSMEGIGTGALAMAFFFASFVL